MSNEVKRYDPINSDGTCGMCIEDADYGAYVEYADYAALEAELAKLRAELERRVPLYEAVERACGELPNGWTIELHMENGAGWVELYDDSGCQVDDFPTDNERLDYTINDAIDAAIAAARKGEGE